MDMELFLNKMDDLKSGARIEVADIKISCGLCL